MFKKTLNEGQAGDNVGLLLRGIKREDVLRGQVPHSLCICLLWTCMQGTTSLRRCLAAGQLHICGASVGSAELEHDVLITAHALQVVCKPGTIKPYKRFEGEIYALKKEEGGRHTPFFTNYKPQFFFRTADITGAQPCCCA